MVFMPGSGFGNIDDAVELIRNLSSLTLSDQSTPTGSLKTEPAVKPFITPPPPLFALIIGINEYKYDAFEKLEGAVADARAVKAYLERSLGVPASQIKTLFNAEATRAAIIASLRDLKSDTRINRGDPILIYYAGHGSTAEVPTDWNQSGWEVGQSEIQILVPHDALCDSDGSMTHGIPDRTIGVLLEQIAQEKDDNITVIFDCCHSGSLTRKTRLDQPRVRGVKMPVKIPPGLDRDIWGGNRGMATAPGFIKSGLHSHVLLAACGAEEKAKEVQGRGYFTRSLLDTLEAVGADKVTYTDLIQRIPCLPLQSPQCAGVKQGRICFNSKAPVRSSHRYHVHEINQQYIVNAGAIHGVTEGAIFGLYNDQNFNPAQPPMAALKAAGPKPLTTNLIPYPQVDLTGQTFALLLRAGEQAGIRIHVELDERLMSAFQALASEVRIDDPAQPKFALAKEKEMADLDIAADDNYIVFNILDPLVTAHGLTRLPFTIEPIPSAITPIIRKAARYFWHLRRAGTRKLEGKVEIEFTRLREVEDEYDDDLNPITTPCGPNLTNDGVVDIVVEANAIYGIKLTNKWDKPLYASLFYFDNSDLSITSYFQPATSSGMVDPPLRPNGSITIGYGPGGGAPFDFSLREGQDIDVGFLKLFISAEQVDLSGIPQMSPFEGLNREKVEGKTTPIRAWSTLLITMVQRRPSLLHPVDLMGISPKSEAQNICNDTERLGPKEDPSMSNELTPQGEPGPVSELRTHTLKPLSRLLTIPYIWAQRILHLARGVEAFHMQSMHIARQALHLVVLLNDSIDEKEGPTDEQQDERIDLGDELTELEEAMRKWGAACGAHEECADRISLIARHYVRFFKPRFYFDAGGSSPDALLQRLLEYDMKTLAFERWQQSSITTEQTEVQAKALPSSSLLIMDVSPTGTLAPRSMKLHETIQDFVEHSMASIEKNNMSNPWVGQLWSRRVTEIAADVEQSGDPIKKAKFEQLVTTVATEFAHGTGSEVFLKRHKAIIESEVRLNEFKAPPSDRDIAMQAAVEKDMRNLDKSLRDIYESSLPLLKELCQILPSKKALKAEDMPSSLLGGKDSISKLQVTMAEVNDKIANLEGLGLVAPTMMVAILKLEDPDANPIYQPCSDEVTFGELMEKTFVAPAEAAKSKDHERDEDDIIPDFWIKRWDTGGNAVTKTGQWWEYQPPSLKIREVFQTAAGTAEEVSQKKWCVETVTTTEDYVIALVNEEGKELGKVLELSRKNAMSTRDHLQKIFENHQVSRVLDLQSGEDASDRKFSKLSYLPKTNPLYIELHAR